jgi:hypothetical protein
MNIIVFSSHYSTTPILLGCFSFLAREQNV